ncbi:MAG TPA: DNA recombination/repair protein RecA, partial [Candidatus Cloacimonetes bacterium]|nr:DNA recombination/repair protein RecA [Candidatus Cloacimonadota bacterium]
IVDEAVNAKIIQKKGSWYSYENTQLGQGKDQAQDYLRDNPKVKNQIEKKVKKSLGIETPTKNEDNKDKQEKK